MSLTGLKIYCLQNNLLQQIALPELYYKREVGFLGISLLWPLST